MRDFANTMLGLAVHFFDLVLYPIYYLIHRPDLTLKRRNEKQTEIKFLSEDSALVQLVNRRHVPNEADHMYQLISQSMASRPDSPCLGVRRVKGETTERNADGKIFNKPVLEDKYTWRSNAQVLQQVGASQKSSTHNSLGSGW